MSAKLVIEDRMEKGPFFFFSLNDRAIMHLNALSHYFSSLPFVVVSFPCAVGFLRVPSDDETY